MTVKLLTEHNLECLSLKGRYTGSSESTHVKIPHCGKSHALTHISLIPRICVVFEQPFALPLLMACDPTIKQ